MVDKTPQKADRHLLYIYDNEVSQHLTYVWQLMAVRLEEEGGVKLKRTQFVFR